MPDQTKTKLSPKTTANSHNCFTQRTQHESLYNFLLIRVKITGGAQVVFAVLNIISCGLVGCESVLNTALNQSYKPVMLNSRLGGPGLACDRGPGGLQQSL